MQAGFGRKSFDRRHRQKFTAGSAYFANFSGFALLEDFGKTVGLLQKRGFVDGLFEPAALVMARLRQLAGPLIAFNQG